MKRMFDSFVKRTPREALRFTRDAEGVVAIEFAVIGALLATSLVIMADLGLAAHARMEMDGALRAGAQAAMAGASDADVELAAEAALPAGSTVNAAASCACPESLGAPAACDATCGSGAVPAVLLDLSTARTYDGLMLPNLDLEASMRVQLR